MTKFRSRTKIFERTVFVDCIVCFEVELVAELVGEL